MDIDPRDVPPAPEDRPQRWGGHIAYVLLALAVMLVAMWGRY